MKSLKILRAILLICLPIAILSLGLFAYKKFVAGYTPPQKKYSAKAAPLVTVQKLVPHQLELKVEGYGKVRPIRSVTLFPEVSGRIIEILPRLKSGYFVKKGEKLIKIDATDYQLKIEKLKAEIKILEARLQRLKQEEKNLTRQLKILKENVRLAQSQKNRTLELIKGGVASKQVWDSDRRVYLEQINRKIEVENRKTLIPTQILEVQATIRSVKVQLKEAQTKWNRTTIRAPFHAKIRSVHIEAGTVANLTSPLVVLDDYSKVEIPVMISQQQLYNIPMKLRGLAYNKRNVLEIPATVLHMVAEQIFSWQGTVVRIEPMDQKNRTIPIIVEVKTPWEFSKSTLDNDNIPLMGGMYCKVEIAGRKINNALTIPRVALRENNSVYVVHKSQLHIKKVKISHRLKNTLVIASGLLPHEQVVVTPLSYAVEEMQVKVSKKGRHENTNFQSR